MRRSNKSSSGFAAQCATPRPARGPIAACAPVTVHRYTTEVTYTFTSLRRLRPLTHAYSALVQCAVVQPADAFRSLYFAKTSHLLDSFAPSLILQAANFKRLGVRRLDGASGLLQHLQQAQGPPQEPGQRSVSERETEAKRRFQLILSALWPTPEHCRMNPRCSSSTVL